MEWVVEALSKGGSLPYPGTTRQKEALLSLTPL
jgi:hypothetical protein